MVVARVLAAFKSRDDANPAPLPKPCGSAALPSASLYRHQWRPRPGPAQPPRTAALHPAAVAGPRILPQLHLLHPPAPSSARDAAAAAELVRMLERAAMVGSRADAMPPSPCYYAHGNAAAYHHHGGAARSFGGFHAPAVSVRSVIPVCAAPPPRAPPTTVVRKEERSGPAAAPAEAGKSA